MAKTEERGGEGGHKWYLNESTCLAERFHPYHRADLTPLRAQSALHLCICLMPNRTKTEQKVFLLFFFGYAAVRGPFPGVSGLWLYSESNWDENLAPYHVAWSENNYTWKGLGVPFYCSTSIHLDIFFFTATSPPTGAELRLVRLGGQSPLFPLFSRF